MFDARDKDIIRQSTSTVARREYLADKPVGKTEIMLVNDGDPGKVAATSTSEKPDNPPLSQTVAQSGMTSGRTSSVAPRTAGEVAWDEWRAGLTPKQAAAQVPCHHDFRVQPNGIYVCHCGSSLSVSKDVFMDVGDMYTELAYKMFASASTYEYKPEGPVLVSPECLAKYEKIMAEPHDIECLAYELFDDQLWDEALVKAEGREDRLTDVLEVMWNREEYQAVRELCEAKATRIVGRR